MRREVFLLMACALMGCREAAQESAKGSGEAAPVPAAAPAATAAADSVPEPGQRPLWKGDRFPDVELTDLDGNTVRTSDLLGGREAIVIFASTTCEACHDLTLVWGQRKSELPEGYPVFAIVDEEVDLATQYVKEKLFKFPLYCDTKSVFYTDYLVDSYPTLVGVGKDGTILYMLRRASPNVTPAVALHMFEDAKGLHQH
jgi:peroxiredoxin